LYPPPTRTSALKLRWFVEDLTRLPMDQDLLFLLDATEHAGTCSKEATMLELIIGMHNSGKGRAVGGALYDFVADNGSKYELGAARPFLFLLYTEHWKRGLAGLVLLTHRGLKRKHVHAWRIEMLYRGGRKGDDISKSTAKRNTQIGSDATGESVRRSVDKEPSVVAA
jgi:hypothetical protein